MPLTPAGGPVGRRWVRRAVSLFLIVGSLTTWVGAQGRNRFRLAEIRGQVNPARGEIALPPEVTLTLSLREIGISYTQNVRFGTFSFEDLGTGNYILEISSKGYETVTQSVTISGSIRGEVQVLTLQLGDPLDGGASIPRPDQASTVSARDLRVGKKVQSLLDKADRASRVKNFQEAIQNFENALKLQPDLPRAWNNLSVQYLKVGKVSQAIKALEQALKYEPNDLTANRNMALLLVALSDFKRALEFLQRLAQLEPGDLEIRAMMAESYLRSGHYQLALEHFGAISKQQPDNPEWLLKMGDCYTRLGRLEEAIGVFRRFLATDAGKERMNRVRTQIEHLETLLPRGCI